MHYYQFNIGDYKSHTEHLSEMEDLAYRRLLDWYYLHEIPIPLDIAETARQIRMRSHSDRIATVLQEFFIRTENGWTHGRADKEIEKSGEKSAKASKSAKERWLKHANALQTQSEGNATHNPLHITHNTLPITQDTTKEIEPSGSLSTAPAGLPDCPYKKLIDLWGKHLPHLPQPRSWEGNRRATMRQRWVQAAKPSDYSPKGYTDESGGIDWWDGFFGYIATGTKLANGFESNGRTWTPDLEWVCNSTNFQKIIDGKYDK